MKKHCLILPLVTRAKFGVRYGAAIIALFLCTFAAVTSARAGLSRLFSEYGSTANSLAAARRARDFNADDPEAHYVHALRLADAGRTDGAVAEFERAASLRPADYFLWQELGLAREESGDSDGAIAALRQAVELAPYYSQPHWQLGNVLLRNNEIESAFSEMRKAATSDPALLPVMIDLAWGISDGDVKAVLAFVQPQTDDQRVLLARFLVTHNQTETGLALIRATAKIATDDRRALVSALIASQEFEAAHQLWLAAIDSDAARDEGLYDGGFESAINAADEGFGWQPTKATQTVHILLDPNESQSGQRSLRLEYAGNFAATVPVISQLVLVAPNARYHLSFAARSENLVSAGLPVVVVREATADARVIAQSSSLPSGTTVWHEFSIDFETSKATRAVTINIQRQVCSSTPCPIVGRVWFDSFSLRRL